MFPISFNTEDEFKQFIIDNKSYIINIINDDDDIIEQNNEYIKIINNLNNKLKEKDEIIKEKDEINQLSNKRDEGLCVVYKGEVCEKLIESDLRECFSNDEYEIDGSKIMNAMDIRINNLLQNLKYGLEIKNKKSITKNDIDKFINDKVTNQFNLSFFLSTECPIIYKNISLNNINSYEFINDNEIYIYSNNKLYIQIVILSFIQSNKNNNSDDNDRYLIDTINSLYKQWCDIKKVCYSMDKIFISHLDKMNISYNGNLYLTPISKCRGQKNPYS